MDATATATATATRAVPHSSGFETGDKHVSSGYGGFSPDAFPPQHYLRTWKANVSRDSAALKRAQNYTITPKCGLSVSL